MSKKTTKRALAMSFVSVFLCVCTLVGTTFAWFTDSASTAVNKIQSGTLDIVLEYESAPGVWTDAKNQTLEFKKASNAPQDEAILWEPGCTYELPAIRVRNNGNLALKYEIVINGVNGDAKLLEAINWTANDAAISTITGALLTKDATSNPIVIKGHMKEDAGNEYQGLEISGIGVTVQATQKDAEFDSFNNQYDANAKFDVSVWDGTTVTAPVADANGVYHISTAADLVGMMNVTGNSIYKGKTIVLDNNIDLGGRTVKGIGGISTNFAGVFDGQGYTISNFKVDSTENSYYAGLFNQVSHGGTIKNLTVKNATIVGNSMVGAVASSLENNAVIDNCKAIDCTLIGVKKVGAVVGYSAGSTVTNNYAENCNVFYSEKEGAKILGYENTGSTVSNNTANNVSVNQGVAVSSADELVALGGTKINGKYILTADIDMTGKAMKSMEISGGAVVNFDGNGHTISNLNLGAAKLHGMTGAGNEVAGLFDLSAPATTVSLTVSDLTVKNATVSCSGFAAAIVGYNSNGGTVITLNNVDVDGATVTADSVAALVAYSTGKVNLNNCDVKGLTLTGEAGRPEKVGAYIGTANNTSCVVTVTNCTNGTTYNNYGRVINGATYN